MRQLHIRYARNLWIYEDMFGCITPDDGSVDPVQKVLSLVPDASWDTNDENLKPRIPDGKFIEETYNPRYITTSLDTNEVEINDQNEEDQ